METRDPEHDVEASPVATSKKSHSDAGKNDASHNDADEGENFQGAPSAGLDSTSSGVTDITSGIAPSDMREVNLKAQHESREDTRGIHSPRESDVIAKGDKIAEPRHTQSAPTNDDMGKDNGKRPMFHPTPTT